MPLTDDVVVRRKVSVRADATAQRRTQILAAAAAAFAEAGYNATSLRDVATRAGLSHTGLLHHFPDKPGLLEAVLDDRVERASAVIPLESEDPDTFLRALVQAAASDAADPDNARLFAVLSAEALTVGHPAHGYMTRWFANVRARMTAAFSKLEEQGRYRGRPFTPAQASIHVSAMRDGATMQWLLAPDEVDFVEAVRSQILLYADVDV
jgi:AcrR family transcriptional regulator